MIPKSMENAIAPKVWAAKPSQFLEVCFSSQPNVRTPFLETSRGTLKFDVQHVS